MHRLFKTEDQVRDEIGDILNLKYRSDRAKQGVGQLTTFNQLGFKGVNDKPDGWYFPKEKTGVAIICEAKNSGEDITKIKWEQELLKNCNIAHRKYRYVIGILYNGYELRVYKNEIEITDQCSQVLESKEYYIDIFENKAIDKELIYQLTARINNNLHFKFGIKNLYHRMIFTACTLVAIRYGADLREGVSYPVLHTTILSTIHKSLEEDIQQNIKLGILEETYADIRMNNTENQEAIDEFIVDVNKISVQINSNNWRGEDVMGIFFNEFNRYKKKSENGQVFTPEHITSFMYRLIDCNKDDYILDAACGSGGFLTKAMSKMMMEAGGINTKKAKKIKREQLFGIEFDREIYALACANMLIHKDGKTNLEQLDTTSLKAIEWMESKPIKKVLMNPPFEDKYHCIDIVSNVLNSVPKGTICAFILPDKKLETRNKKKVKKILDNHRLEKIVKLSEKTFFEGVNTSVFVFKTGVAQSDHNIIGYYIKEDGLETVKNKGRQDVKKRWSGIEDYWINAIRDGEDSLYHTKQIINPKEHLSYQTPEKEFVLFDEDFNKAAIDYIMYEQEIDYKKLSNRIVKKALYGDMYYEDN